MWLPTSYAHGLLMALAALCCWGSWSTTFAATKDTMNFEQFYVNWAVSFLLTGWVVGLIGGSTGDGMWQIPGESAPEPSYIRELFGHNIGCYPLSMLGGTLWNFANALGCKSIALMGQALGFPIFVGLGLVTGAITAYTISPEGNLLYLASGVCTALLAICLTGYLSYRKERELQQASGMTTNGAVELALRTGESHTEGHSTGPSMRRKLILCSTAGLFMGVSNVGVTGSTSDKFMPCTLSPYANQSFFSLGVFLSSCVFVPLMVWYPVEGGTGTSLRCALSGFMAVRVIDHVLSVLGGFILCMGFFFFNLGSPQLGSATAYSIGQSAPLVAILWGTFFFKEFKGTSARVWGLIPIVCLFFIVAVVLVGSASA